MPIDLNYRKTLMLEKMHTVKMVVNMKKSWLAFLRGTNQSLFPLKKIIA